MQRRFALHLMVIVILITQISCQFVTDLAGIGGGSSHYNQPGNPIDLTIRLDNVSATQVIPASGGELSVTGSDGSRYTLSIPAGALEVSTEISMTPITAIDGLPFSGGLGGAVKLEPSGLGFFDFVTLTIEPANPIALEKQILFGFEASGEDLHLALPGADKNQVQIRLLHFSGAGVASGVSTEVTFALQRMADRVEARLTSEMGAYLQDLRNGKDPNPDTLEALLDEYYNSVVVRRLKAATSASATCADAKKAIQTFLGWDRQRQLLGGASNDTQFEKFVSDYFPVLTKKCLDEEFDRCANKHQIAGMLPALLGFDRMGQLLGAFSASNPAADDKNWAEVRDYGQDLLRRCYQWDLEFESAGTFDDGDVGYDSRVKAVVPIRVQGDVYNLQFGGTSVLDNLDFSFHINECSVKSKTGGGDFTADSLGWVAELRKDQDGEERYFVKDFVLKYNPGLTSESFSVSCPGSPTITPPQSNFWNSLFIVTHYQEADQGNGAAPALPDITTFDLGSVQTAQVQAYIAQNWQAFEAELMATKEWEGVSEITPTVFEGGSFKLYHRPQK